MQKKPHILIVDDEEYICTLLCRLLKCEGFDPSYVLNGHEALKTMSVKKPDALIVDFRMPDMNGLELFNKVNQREDLPCVMITAYADIPGAVQAVKSGVYHYMAKPFDHSELIGILRQAIREKEIDRVSESLSAGRRKRFTLTERMGSSGVIRRLEGEVKLVAQSNLSVLIFGETGTGKELVARFIHNKSSHRQSIFVPVDCGAIPETLAEAEMFGHEKGSFTDAKALKVGKFERADGGTLFLDELLNMRLNSQAILLRVLQNKQFFRIGGLKPVEVDFRLLAASNRDIESAVKIGEFREDLFYRMSEYIIRIPPLRERKEDIPYLAKRFLKMSNTEMKKNVKGFSKFALKKMRDYDWPGNVRQLRSTIRRAVLLAEEMITDAHLDINKEGPARGGFSAPKILDAPWENRPLKEIVCSRTRAVEREVLQHVLKLTEGNKAKAARLLQIDYKTIHTKLKKLEISIPGREL